MVLRRVLLNVLLSVRLCVSYAAQHGQHCVADILQKGVMGGKSTRRVGQDCKEGRAMWSFGK